MKRFIIILICMLSVSFHAYSHDYYYWYQGKQIPLRQGSRFYIIYDAKESKGVDSLQVIEGGYLSFSKETQLKWGIVSEQTIANAKNVLYQMPSFVSSDTTQNMYVTHRFYIKLKQQDDLILLNNLLEQYQAEIEQEGDFPLWYIIRCGFGSQYNALSLANIFYESGLFAVAEPEFMNAIQLDCVSDPMFSQQWNLKNTGQWFESYSGIDINYCDAHAITSGNASVIIGVYDIGVDLTHPDINLYPYSYDANTQSSPSTIYTDANGHNYHGTACAGIIGAKTDNSIGIAGIAPDCPIMSISFYNTTTQKVGNAFKVAANQGCSVISNSWRLGASSGYVNEGISYALSQGRDGKGCVIVFSAGNENRDSVNYPANSNDSIIVVGAMSPCGERCNPLSCDGYNWGSNYGSKLDIMAPGVLIRTTDLVGTAGDNSSDYKTDFMGTSAACPHVAAVAGLILSVNPYLTQKEVADIIESTAQKIGVNINYEPTPNRPNGTWNNHFGYGLIDAYAAVLEAQNRYPIQGPDYFCDTTCFSLLNVPEGATCQWTVHLSDAMMGSMSIVSGQGTQNVCVRYLAPLPFHSNGDHEEYENAGGRPNLDFHTYVTVTVVDNATSTPLYTVRKDLRPPTGATPIITTTDSTPVWYSRTSRTFFITNIRSVPDSAVQWTVKRYEQIVPPTPQVVHTNYYYGAIITYNPPIIFHTHRDTLVIYATNLAKECEPKQSNIMRFILRPGKPVLNGTQNGDQLDVNIYEEREETQYVTAHLDENCSYTLELWNNIYGRMRTKAIVSATEQMDIHNIPKGVYVLTLKENGTIIAQTKVLIQ